MPLMSIEVPRPRQPERHGRHERLPAGQHAAVVAGDFGQDAERFRDRLRRVIGEGRGFHARGLYRGRRSVPAGCRTGRPYNRARRSASSRMSSIHDPAEIVGLR